MLGNGGGFFEGRFGIAPFHVGMIADVGRQFDFFFFFGRARRRVVHRSLGIGPAGRFILDARGIPLHGLYKINRAG